jgi:hypothetical protein
VSSQSAKLKYIEPRLQNKFYLKSEQQQRIFQVKMVSLLVLFLLPIFFISYILKMYVANAFSIWISLSILAPFFDVPSMVKRKQLKYYSALLLAEKKKKKSIIIHGGTLFDYFFSIDKNIDGKKRKTLILQQYIEGLTELIKEYRNSDNPNLMIKGTTYILNEKTGKKLGFTPERPGFVQALILIFNYPNLLVAKSFANGKLSLPNLTRIRTFKTTLSKLVENEALIGDLNERLKRTLAQSNQAS